MASEDDIVLNLIIKGMDPSEVQRLVQSTQGEINVQMGRKLDELTVLHKKANEAQTKEVKKRIDEEIKDAGREINAINQVMKAQQANFDAQEKAAKKAADAIVKEQDRIAKAEEKTADARKNDLKNLAIGVIAIKSAFDIAVAAIQKAGQIAHEIVEITQIYNGLQGSIDQMRESTGGAVADIDLIAAKNRGYMKELHLTDEQYGLVAKAAQRFADVTGGSTKDALDKVIDGLANGNEKALKSIGIYTDLATVYEKAAQALGVTADSLTQEQKLAAFQEAQLETIRKKTDEWGDSAVTVASAIEVAFASARNAITKTAAAIGNIKVSQGRELSDKEIAAMEAMPAPMGGGKNIMLEQALARRDAYRKARDAQRNAEADKAYEADFGAGSTLNADDSQQDQMNRMRAQYQGLSDIERAKLKSKKGPTRAKDPNLNSFRGEGVGEFNSPDELDRVIAKHEGIAAIEANKGANADYIDEAAMDRAVEVFNAHSQKLQEVVDAAGGSAFSRLLFGPGGPDKTLEEMDAFQQSSVQLMGMVSAAAHKMAEALGASLAASIAGGKGAKKSVRDTTEAILEGLAAQAFTKALFATAEGLFMVATGNPGATVMFASAAKYAAVGAAAGLAARAVGTDSSGSSASGGGSGISSNSSGFTSPRSSGGSDGGNKAPIVVNLSVWPGGEAEAGRQVAKALGAFTRETGVSINDVTTGKAAA